MKHTIIKMEEIDVTFNSPLYVSYLSGMHYRFVQLSDGRIEVTSIFVNGDCFDLAIRFKLFETDVKAMTLSNGYKEITPDEFYNIANELLSRSNLIPIYNYQTP